MTWHCTHVGHRVVAAGRSDAQKLHVRVSLHRLKDLFQCWDGNVLQHRQKDITFTFLQRIYTYWSWSTSRITTIGEILLFPVLLRHRLVPAQLTLMLLRLTSVRLLSLLWILSRVSSTLVGFGGSSGKILNGSGFTTPAGGTTTKVRRNILRGACPAF